MKIRLKKMDKMDKMRRDIERKVKMDIKVNIEGLALDAGAIEEKRTDASKALDRLWSGSEDMTGWVQAPINVNEQELEFILNAADVVKHEADLFVVVGIGGSYLGAKAAIEALPKTESGTPVRFFGTNFCTDYYREVIAEMKSKKPILCVISKSGNTTEIRAAFDTLKPVMEEKYGSREEAAKRILAVTDEKDGSLRKEADENGYTTMVIPKNIGGRYSALTPAGLLPMAVSGIDIRELLGGAKDMATSPDWDDHGTDYAIARHLMQKQGKTMEVIAMCHSRLGYLGEWIKQLYGESEGKNGQGLWPATLTYSTDLHSMGQYIQQGRQNFFETVVSVDDPQYTITIPEGTLEGKTIEELNRAMTRGVINAHRGAGIPVAEIHIPKLDPYYYGQLLYFLETTCAVTAMLDGVNPFDQPGVEAYKAEMRKLLGI